jgi:hypothetical protein
VEGNAGLIWMRRLRSHMTGTGLSHIGETSHLYPSEDRQLHECGLRQFERLSTLTPAPYSLGFGEC